MLENILNVLENMLDYTQLPSLISLFISGLAIYYTVRQYRLSKRANILRPHSDRLAGVLESWLESGRYIPSVLSLENLPEDETVVHLSGREVCLWGLRFVEEHLKTGYRKKYRELEDLRERIAKHNEEIKKFVELLCGKLKEELGLPDRRSGSGYDAYAYYRRIVVILLTKITVSYPETEPRLLQDAKPSEKWKLEWSGSILIVGTKKDCEKGLSLIKELSATVDLMEKTMEFLREAKALNDERTKLMEWLRINLVDKIKIGGVIDGKCAACK